MYAIPGAIAIGGYAAGKYAGFPEIDQLAYLVSSLCCVGALTGLSAQTTSRQGNSLGMYISSVILYKNNKLFSKVVKYVTWYK